MRMSPKAASKLSAAKKAMSKLSAEGSPAAPATPAVTDAGGADASVSMPANPAPAAPSITANTVAPVTAATSDSLVPTPAPTMFPKIAGPVTYESVAEMLDSLLKTASIMASQLKNQPSESDKNG